MVLLLVVTALVFDVVLAPAQIVLGSVVPPDVVLQIAGMLAWGLTGSVAAVCYHDLRILKEGAADRSLARVFE